MDSFGYCCAERNNQWGIGMARGNRKAEGDSAEGAEAKTAAPVYRKKDLVDSVATRSGVKKKAVKPVVDAVLAELASALQRGDVLSMPPLGKLAVNRSKEGARADVMILKLRRLRPGVGKKADDVAEEETVEAAE